MKNKLIPTLALVVTLFIGACDQNNITPPNTSGSTKLTKDQYLDSLFKNNVSLSTVLMIDSTVMKGSMGLRFTDTVIFGTDEAPNYRFRYVVLPIGNVEPWSKDQGKYAIYTQVRRYISIKSADSSSQYGLNTGDTGLSIAILQFQRVSRVLPDMTPYEASVYLETFPHKNTNEQAVIDSFINHYHAFEENWFGFYAASVSKYGMQEIFYNDPSDPSAGNLANEDGFPHLYYYVFKAGRTTEDDVFDNDIFQIELDRDDPTSMEITTQKLADGREHQVMFLKIPYTYWKDYPYVSGFVRFRYVLN
jgi:hypothetical protein